MNGDLGEFFSLIGKAKKEKEDEFRSLVGELDIDSMFSQVKVSIKEDRKKKEKEEKQIKALESWLFSEPKKKEEVETIEVTKSPIVGEDETNYEEWIEEEVKEREEAEATEEVKEVKEEIEDTVDHALKILETIKSKEEVRENLGDPEILKIRRELEYLKNLVNAQGGGGEVNLRYLDDIVGVATNLSAYDGMYLGIDISNTSQPFKFSAVSGGGSGDYASVAGIATYATLAGVSTYAETAGVSTYSVSAGIATYSSTSGVSTYSNSAGIATYSTTAGIATNAQGLTGTPDITVQNIIGVAATFTGVVTYEDVTNIDSIGIVTARSGVYFGSPTISTIETNSATTTTTDQTSIDSFSASTYRSAKYQIQITRDSEYQVTEISIVHDGTDSYGTEYATLKTGSTLATFSTDVSGGNVRLLATPTSTSSSVFKFTKTTIVV